MRPRSQIKGLRINMSTNNKTSVHLQSTFTETDWLECQRLAQFSVSKLRARFKLSSEEVEDLTSEGTIAAVSALKSWKPDKGTKSTWLLRRVNGEIIDQIKKLRYAGLTGELKGVSVFSASGLTAQDDENENGNTGESLNFETLLGSNDDFETNQQALSIALAVEQLSTADRRLIEEYYGLSGIGATKSLRAIGASMGISGEAVRLRINRILTDLSN
jgi:RNA polymerase sigma factor (sigma-70 family)